MSHPVTKEKLIGFAELLRVLVWKLDDSLLHDVLDQAGLSQLPLALEQLDLSSLPFELRELLAARLLLLECSLVLPGLPDLNLPELQANQELLRKATLLDRRLVPDGGLAVSADSLLPQGV